MSADVRLTNTNVEAIGKLYVRQTENSNPSLEFVPSDARLTLGNRNNDGDFRVRNADGITTFNVDGKSAKVVVGTKGTMGWIELLDKNGDITTQVLPGMISVTGDGGFTGVVVLSPGSQSSVSLQNGDVVFTKNGRRRQLLEMIDHLQEQIDDLRGQ